MKGEGRRKVHVRLNKKSKVFDAGKGVTKSIIKDVLIVQGKTYHEQLLLFFSPCCSPQDRPTVGRASMS